MSGPTLTGKHNRSSCLADRGWRRQVVDLVGLIVGLVLYSCLHRLTGTNASAATGNAHTLQAVERSLHLNIEVAANHWLTGHPALMQSAVLYYRLYYLPLAGVLLWVLLQHAEVYKAVRRILIVMAFLALLVFWLIPMSPPRFALAGIVDVVAAHDPIAGGASRDLTNGQNHYSAMPSLHVGWSALCAYAAWLALRDTHPRLALLTWLFPTFMVAVVITTGNHYVLDVVGSAVLLTISMVAASVWHRSVELNASILRHNAVAGGGEGPSPVADPRPATGS